VTLLNAEGPITDDPWTALGDGAPLPAAGDVILPLPRLLAEAEALSRRAGRTGVKLEPHEAVEELAPHVRSLSAVWLAFPKFRDGRGYSAAHLLRKRFGFQGPIRAVGDVLRDQLRFMLQCGITEFALRDPDAQTAAALLKAAGPRPYQTVLSADSPVFLARRMGASSE
jgi:uncharacterized protein (DUF934 family)